MFAARVVGHDVHEDAQIAGVRLLDQHVHICQGAEEWIHIAIVRYVIAGVVLR